ncbi:MAG: glycosyltransferase family protein [Deltaproteobacteria bacterium]|nr:glycosyltransferase family protein [Deltaproteobacteria bacterium]
MLAQKTQTNTTTTTTAQPPAGLSQPTVFFALASEGMGHATRAAPLIDALRQRGYRVEVFCGGRVAAFLRTRVGHVHEHFFIPLHYTNNQLDIFKSFKSAIARLGPCLREAWSLFWRMRKEKPVAVVSDFEFMSAWLGWWSGTPVIAVDNMHLITHGAMPEPPTKQARKEKKDIARAIWWNQPVVDKILITCFWQPGLKAGVNASKVRFVPCAARPEVLARRHRTRTDGPVLVYQTSSTNHDLPGTLQKAGELAGLKFVVYGAGRPACVEGAVEYRAFSESGFLDDLAASPFCIVNGGHSTMVEALALGKPVLSEPIQKQYEQQANAVGLETLGVGKGVSKMTVEAIVDFAKRAPAMRERAAEMSHVVDNAGLADAVEECLRELDPVRALPARQATVTALVVDDDYALAAE